MRIAVSGSHATGKSTLIAELRQRLSGYAALDEPYSLLAEEGHVFADPPASEDFEPLLDRSVSLLLAEQATDLLFDRCPVDYLAYLTVLDPTAMLADRLAEAAPALATLDLVVLVPIERPDRMDGVEAPRLRRRVDRLLEDMLVEGTWGIEVPIVVVHGSAEERAEQVLARVAAIAIGDHAVQDRTTSQPHERRS